MDDVHFMRQALSEAEEAFALGEVPVGAVVVANDRIIARAHNLTEQLSDVTAHAEMQAFTAAAISMGGKYLEGCTLYVTLEPCVMCAGASYWTQIGRIVYGASDPKRGFTKLSQNILHPTTEVVGGVLASEAASLITRFFSNKRRK
ncbi:MAG: nucleoside deaminase [Bacteroidales bacterium]|nr:nucleoside deaminase [Bacteroidales bacterium]